MIVDHSPQLSAPIQKRDRAKVAGDVALREVDCLVQPIPKQIANFAAHVARSYAIRDRGERLIFVECSAVPLERRFYFPWRSHPLTLNPPVNFLGACHDNAPDLRVSCPVYG
jgi:hypothetical protein